MITMYVLRMLVDVSFFCTFAGFAAAKFGSGGVFAGMLIQCACYGLSGLAGSRRGLRLAALLPIALCWVIAWPNVAECIFLIPTAVYVVWLVWKGDYTLEHERQKRLFGVFWKIMVVFIPLAVIFGGAAEITAVSVPYALIMLVCSVLLLRALRHDEKVYCSRQYQVTNILTVFLALAAAYLVSSKAVLNAAAAGLKAVYTAVLQPILALLLNLILMVIWGIGWLWSLLPFGDGEMEFENMVQMDLSGTKEIIPDDLQLKEPSDVVQAVAIVLGVAAAVVLLVLFFRWLNRREGRGAEFVQVQEQREGVGIVRIERKEKETQPVKKIRAQYRGFLKWCAGAGVHTEKASTTLDVHRSISAVKGCDETSNQIRKIYIQARYADRADKNAAKEMKQLCEQIKKPKEKSTV